jgi:hypothetical protein
MEFEVLHALAVRKSGTAEQVARLLGAAEAEVAAALDALTTAGAVAGARGIVMPTPTGRSTLDDEYADRFAGLRADESFTAAFERFEALNPELLALLTRWQTVSRAGTSLPNDHSDPDYDAKVLDELGDLHERAEPVLAALAAPEPRYAAYATRLGEAYERALTGEPDYVSGVRVDSYHTVWHQLHEDLLRTLGRERRE